MEDEIDFKEYYVMLKKNWALAILIFALIFAAVLAYTLTTPKTYEARSLAMITSQDQTALILQSTATRIDIGTQKEIILSYSVLSSLYPDFAGQNFKIGVEAIKDSNIIEIRAESTSPQIAMGVANRVAISYVNYTRESKKQEAGEVSDFISEQLTSYKQEIDFMNRLIAQYNVSANMSIDDKNRYQTLQREMAAKNKLYDYLLSKREETNIAVKEKSSNVRIIEYAGLPINPIKPNVPLNLALGAILAIIISMGTIFFKEQLKATFKSQTDLESELGSVILGAIPKLSRKEFNKAGQEKGIFPESILALRTNLMLYLRDKETKVISITSPQKEEGKSIISANLALSMAHAGKKVLLVDANLRNPSLNSMFDVKKDEEGLTNAIPNPGKIGDYIRKTKYKNLFFLPSGERQNSPIEALLSDSMKSVMSKLQGSIFDVVIMDTAALEYSESLMTCANSEGVILVVAHDRTEKANIKKSKEMLRKAKANIIGVVVNFSK